MAASQLDVIKRSDDQRSTFERAANQPTLATVPDTAKEHGIALSTLYELAASGTAPGVVRLGRRILIHRRIFSEWLEVRARGGGQQ